MRAEVPFAEVLAAVRTRACASEEPVESNWTFLAAVAHAADVRIPDLRVVRHDSSWQKFTGQTGRALKRLAERGELVKVRQTAPVAKTVYYRPEAWRQRQAALREEVAEQHAEHAFWERLYDELALYGIDSTVPRGEPVQLSSEHWLEVIQRLHAGGTYGGSS